jgi:VCBS repeat-containing protein
VPATTSVNLTGNSYVDGVLSGVKWAVTNLTYSFPASASFYGSTYGDGEPGSGFLAFTAIQQTAVQKVLANYSAIANLTFTQVTETASQHGDLRYAESNLPGTAWGYYPTPLAEGGDAWFNNSSHNYDNPVLGNYAFATVLHETGHLLGLKHPHEVSGLFAAMPADKDSLEYSVMSYHSYAGSPLTGYTNGSFSFPQSLMMYDIASVQAMYGANYKTNSGDTVYTWSPTTGEESINGVGQGAPGGNKVFQTIWDGGGNDTYNFSNYTTGLKIDLNPGGWITTSTTQLASLGNGHVAVGNIANALLYQNNPASLIENAIGGSGNDIIVGNIANNSLTGGKGNDSLDGAAGIDTAIYSGLQANYSVVQNSDGTWTVTDLQSGSPDGTDTLTNMELLKFSDTTVGLGATQNPPPPPPPQNHAPVATNDKATTKEDSAVDINVLVNDTDADHDPLSIFGTPSALHGTVTVNSNGTLHYTPGSNYNGADTITYKATDGSLSATGQVAVTVTAVNDAPVANADAYSVGKNVKLTVTGSGVLGNDTDPDGGSHIASLVSGTQHGTLKLSSNGAFTYTPNRNFTGTDSFIYKDSDGSLSSTAKVTLTVGSTQSANGHGNDVAGGVPDMTNDQAPAWVAGPDAHHPGPLDVHILFHHDHGFLLT